MSAHVEVRPGAYADSVALMLASRTVAEAAGVSHALIAMATPLNLELLSAAGYGISLAEQPTSDDLLIAITAEDDTMLARARALADEELSRRPSTDGPSATAAPPRTTGAAARRGPRPALAEAAGVALISVPGEHAVVEAVEAIEAGLHPMVFSDQVGLDDEVALKDLAARHGLLVMGPDCGTAIIGGVGLGFANVVRPGPVGIVAASGTGAQHLACLLDDAQIGVRHVLGVGGRDVTAEVGGRSTLVALDLLDADPATELVVVLAKPPAPEVEERLEQAAASARGRVLTGFVGPGRDLTAVAQEVAQALGRSLQPARWLPQVPQEPRHGGDLRGLFAGGTLCAEASAIWSAGVGSLASTPDADGHMAVDLGDDRYTAGRPHPMIDQSLRLDHLAAEASRPGSHVVMLDVVLGHGAHPDPAAELAPAISDARRSASQRGDDLAVVVSLIGTAGDPQDRAGQAEVLQHAGAAVHTSNAAAARHALALIAGAT